MSRSQWTLGVAMCALLVGCHHQHGSQDGGDNDGGVENDAGMIVSGGDLVITPADATLDITPMQTGVTQAYTAKTMGGTDVTSMATWSVDDTTLGSFAGATFTAGGQHGGTSFVRASFQGTSGFATVNVKLHATVTSDTCPGCPAFPPDTTPACSATAMTPTILYPPNGTLVPPNMNVFETQFDQGTGNTLFEIDYENAATDVRVETRCNPITDSKSNATNGCDYALSQQVWDYLSLSNAGGDPLNIIVRATNSSGSCIATSQSQVALSFAEQPLLGGLYYWQSVAVTGLQGATGGIFRYDFGVRGQTPQPFLAPTASGGTMQRCIGCHFLSRDGAKMTYGNDDADADDEYSDLDTSLIDVSTKAVVSLLRGKGGFQAFAPDHSVFVATDGAGSTTMGANPDAFFLFNGSTGAAASPATVATGTARATQPDYAPDGSKVVFVEPANFKFATYNRTDDNHFTGGSLFTMTASGTTFGTPTPLLASTGENNYYPAYSPDGAFVAFNRVALTGTAAACANDSCPNDAFSNPNARVMIMPAAGGTPVDLTKVNGTGALANSWPRFAPNAQTYKGHQIAWVTFSSTRDYGDVVRNSAMVAGAAQHLCYPPESPENTSTNKNVTTDPSCLQPQLWMAAIDLTAAATGADPSYVAFWLPFQDPTAHNHIAQWVESIEPTGGDGGMCIADNMTCTSGGSPCCNGFCCSTNVCGCIPIQ